MQITKCRMVTSDAMPIEIDVFMLMAPRVGAYRQPASISDRIHYKIDIFTTLPIISSSANHLIHSFLPTLVVSDAFVKTWLTVSFFSMAPTRLVRTVFHTSLICDCVSDILTLTFQRKISKDKNQLVRVLRFRRNITIGCNMEKIICGRCNSLGLICQQCWEKHYLDYNLTMPEVSTNILKCYQLYESTSFSNQI